MVSKPEEREWVARARGGDEEAFRALVRRYQGEVYNLAGRILRNREDAEDAAQEVFVRVYGALHQYDPSHPFRNWLLRITHNLCIDHLRRKRISTVSMDEPIRQKDGEVGWELPDPDAPDPLEAVIYAEERGWIEEAIASLGPTLRAAITLRHLHGLRYEEIAEILDVPLGTVKVRIFRARAALAKLLARRMEGENG
jgi:RNA polymerase sigma-70 factor (ECF subfamily)